MYFGTVAIKRTKSRPVSRELSLLFLVYLYVVHKLTLIASLTVKLFNASDVSPFKRAKTNLSEVRAVMTIIDLNATKHGMTIKSVMTPEEAKECVRVGYTGLNISPKTPDGRERDILTMKWSSAVRLKGGKEKKSPDKSPQSPEPLAEASVDL